ncbi:hypothetical protein ACFE04_029874 [Oxalis oulophora]
MAERTMEEGSIAMNGGDGAYSYSRNSKFQAGAADIARELLIKGIQENLTIDSNNQVFRIADLGCSVGPNTFTSVGTIIKAVENKFETLGLESNIPEFQVFFNDRDTNDFNTLFKNLPSPRQYMAAGVPGSFYNRLFPKASMNFLNSSYANQWLTNVPQEVTKEGSLAWNKGSITYAGSSIEVVEAYKAQFSKDMDKFFRDRSMELTEGGLLAILMPCRSDGTHPSESKMMQSFNWLGDALYDLAKQGIINEALVDSFNLPIFIPSPSELKDVVLKNDLLSIEILKKISYHVERTPEVFKLASFGARAVFEGIVSQHFGSEIIDDLFAKYVEKMIEGLKSPSFVKNKDMEVVFLLVKRNQFPNKLPEEDQKASYE